MFRLLKNIILLKVPDYYNIVQKPMDLQTVRDGILKNKYRNRVDFPSDVNQILDNSTLYNGKLNTLLMLFFLFIILVTGKNPLNVYWPRIH